MTIMDQLRMWQEELHELRHEMTALSPNLSSAADRELLNCATAVSSDRMPASPSHGLGRIPRAGQSERKIDLSVRGYLETSASGIIRRTNNATALLLNFPRHLLVGQPLVVFIKKEERIAFLKAFAELRFGGQRRSDYLAMIQPVGLDAHLAMLIAERVEDPDRNILGFTWLWAPAWGA